MSYLDHLLMVLGELAPWLLLGAAVSGLLHGLLPEGFVARHLQGKGGVAKAVFLGVPLPLCSCGVIPAGVGLKRDGASDGAAVGFLTATPQTGVDSVLVSAGLLGLPFALMKVVAALVTGLVSGWLVDATAPDQAVVTPATPSHASHSDRSWRGMAAHAVDMVRMIWRWLVFGVLLSAALGAWLPPGTLAGLGSGLWAFVLVLLASVPLYVCATASVPIAAALVASGLPTGAALVFLMAGPATNVATLGAVWRGFGGRVLAIYLATLVLGSVGFGLAFDVLAEAVGFAALAGPDPHAHHGPMPWWREGSAVVLVLGLAWFAVEDVRALWARWRSTMTTQASTDETPVVSVSVAGMTCNGCTSRLERVLQREAGVTAVTVSLDDARAEVRGAVSRERVLELIEQAGFEPS